MHKSKLILNLKIIISLFALVAAVGIAFSAIQAFATSQDAAQPNETVDVTFTPVGGDYGHIITKDYKLTMTLEAGSVLVSHTTNNIGHLYLKNGSEETLIATAYPSYVYVFNQWVLDDSTPVIDGQEVTITKNSNFRVDFDANPFSDNTGVITGTVVTGDSLETIKVLENYKVFFRTHAGDIYETYTDVNGHFRLTGIPFYTPGALNGYMEGYVSDYSSTITLGNADPLTPGIDLGTVMISKGINVEFNSNKSDQMFNVSKWYISVTQPPLTLHLADELTVPVYQGHQFPEGSLFRVLKEDETVNIDDGGTRTFKAGTLVYTFVFEYGVVGGIRYEIYFEPSNNLPWNGWTYSNNKVKNTAVPALVKDDEDNGLEIDLASGDYTFNMNYGDPVPVTPPVEAAKTGDNNFAAIAMFSILALTSCAYLFTRRIRKH